MLTMKTIGQTIRDERKEMGLRQDELAAAAGVGTRFIVDVEAGKETAEIGKVLTVLSALGCNLEIKLPSGVTVQEQSA